MPPKKINQNLKAFFDAWGADEQSARDDWNQIDTIMDDNPANRKMFRDYPDMYKEFDLEGYDDGSNSNDFDFYYDKYSPFTSDVVISNPKLGLKKKSSVGTDAFITIVDMMVDNQQKKLKTLPTQAEKLAYLNDQLVENSKFKQNIDTYLKTKLTKAQRARAIKVRTKIDNLLKNTVSTRSIEALENQQKALIRDAVANIDNAGHSFSNSMTTSEKIKFLNAVIVATNGKNDYADIYSQAEQKKQELINEQENDYDRIEKSITDALENIPTVERRRNALNIVNKFLDGKKPWSITENEAIYIDDNGNAVVDTSTINAMTQLFSAQMKLSAADRKKLSNQIKSTFSISAPKFKTSSWVSKAPPNPFISSLLVRQNNLSNQGVCDSVTQTEFLEFIKIYQRLHFIMVPTTVFYTATCDLIEKSRKNNGEKVYIPERYVQNWIDWLKNSAFKINASKDQQSWNRYSPTEYLKQFFDQNTEFGAQANADFARIEELAQKIINDCVDYKNRKKVLNQAEKNAIFLAQFVMDFVKYISKSNFDNFKWQLDYDGGVYVVKTDENTGYCSGIKQEFNVARYQKKINATKKSDVGAAGGVVVDDDQCGPDNKKIYFINRKSSDPDDPTELVSGSIDLKQIGDDPRGYQACIPKAWTMAQIKQAIKIDGNFEINLYGDELAGYDPMGDDTRVIDIPDEEGQNVLYYADANIEDFEDMQGEENQ